MANQRLQHDAAIAIAQASFEIVSDFIRPDMRRQIWGMLYEAAKSGIECYEIYANRMQHRLHPSKN